MPQNGQIHFENLAGFAGIVFDHFGTLCIKGLILSKTQFSWKFHWDSSSCSEDVKFSSSIITSFINFFNFWFFDISL